MTPGGLGSLARDIGGPDVLADLDDAPLPHDEAFDWSVVPEDVRDRLAEVLNVWLRPDLLTGEGLLSCVGVSARPQRAGVSSAVSRRVSGSSTSSLSISRLAELRGMARAVW